MIVSIHQPQYIPWVPYFSKINQSDIFVLLDDVQFQKNGMQNRNFILNNSTELRMTLPVKVHLGDLIKDVEITNLKACEDHLKTISVIYKKSPFYLDVLPIIEHSLMQNGKSLMQISNDFIINVLKYLEINTQIVNSSDLVKSGKKSELVLSICKTLNACCYLSGSGGIEYLDFGQFENEKIKISLQTYHFNFYEQFNNRLDFIPKLSILDLLFNKGKETIKYI